MNFKDFLAQDLSTFLNLEEFAEVVEIDGEKVKAVLSRQSAPSLTYYGKKNNIDAALHGVKLSGDFLTIYVKAADLVKPPRNNDFITINGERFSVSSVGTLHDLTKITCAKDADKPSLPRLNF